MSRYNYEKKFDLVDTLKGFQRPLGVPGQHFDYFKKKNLTFYLYESNTDKISYLCVGRT